MIRFMKGEIDMETKDYYTLKEIILGLHDEYQLHQQELQKLKELCERKENKATDFNFRVFQPENKKPVLLCDYEPRQNRIQRVMTDLSKKVGYYIYGRNTAYLVTDNNRYYFLCGHKSYPVHVRYDDGMEEKFYNQASAILNSTFSNSICSKYIEKNDSNIDAALTIDTRYIQLYIRNNSDKTPRSTIWYNPSFDTIEFQSFNGKLNTQHIENTLNIKFPSNGLSSYHIQTINMSNLSEKPMVLKPINPTSRIIFEVQEEKQVILSKTRR